jgi:hypothetical protein
MASTAVQLKITLLDTEPPVWRQVVVPGSTTLDQLHEIFQTAMGWQNYHLHLFEIDGVVYGDDEEMDFDLVGDELDTKLAEVVRAGSHFRYEYDFGDGWQHHVEVEEVRPARGVSVECLDGERACPPEDCGGATGFARILQVLADPNHPDHDQIAEDYADFDPHAFDVATPNELLSL